MKLGPHDNPLNIDYNAPEIDDNYITLNCLDCEFVECKIAKKIIMHGSKEGCTRRVSEKTLAKFYHYIEEVLPFWKMHSIDYIDKSYREIIEFLYDEVYAAPIGQRLDPRGKVRTSGY